MSRMAIFLIKFYRLFISPLKPASCRFYPSCSAYAMESFQEYGFFKGLFLTLKRIIRCHPFCEGGYDPVPRKDSP
ncbi:MAG: membrane protein insertion efficiency factor YidD [Firmicutes bacterium]|nr:membrane protein insertion efficiency factor YidD [Bacillota bacterium]